MKTTTLHRVFPLGLGLALAACGDSGGASDAATTAGDATATGDTMGDVALPTDCWLPAAPSAAMDCALMCQKVAACGVAEAGCLTECAELRYVLAPDAGPKVEQCFVDLPCNGGPAVFGAVGCVARLADDATFTPAAGAKDGCDALIAKAETCGLSTEAKDGLAFQCDKLAVGLSAEVMGRAAACASESCEGFAACVDASSCAWQDVLTPGGTGHDDEDACLDERDRSAIATGGVYAKAMTCGDTCAGQSSECPGNCVVDATDLTAACSRCFGALGLCVHDHCDAECADPTAAGCYACQQSAGCAAAFATCSGGPVPGSPQDGACTEKDRQDIAGSGDITESVTKCVAQCQDGASCADNCMWTVLDLAEDGRCSACGGDLAVCAATECATACDDSKELGECYACLDGTTCFDAFAACSGVTVAPPAGAACVGVADSQKAADGSAWGATAACIGQCAGQGASCYTSCVATADVVSDACEPCYAALGGCAATKCASTCGAAPKGIECATCLADGGCVSAFDGCGGLAPYPAPGAGADTCGEALACATACGNSPQCVEDCVTKAVPAQIELARRTADCVRVLCAGQDASCIATTCLADYQQCVGTTPELSCTDLGSCLGACGDSAECQLGCFAKAKDQGVVDALLGVNQCIVGFCGAAPSDACRDIVLADPALCASAVAACADPEAAPPSPTCGDIVTCMSYCPDADCQARCAEGASADARSQMVAFYQCANTSCAGGAATCVYGHCFNEFSTCFAPPSNGLGCYDVYTCVNDAACTLPSCQNLCVAAAADGGVAVAFQSLIDCFQQYCVGPNGWVPGCAETEAAAGGHCADLANSCQ